MDKCMEKLLSLKIEEPKTETRTVTRLGLDITVREMTYDEVERSIREKEDRDINYLLAATVSPNFRDPAWYEQKMDCATPVAALKKLLRHGEVTQLVKVIDRLNGYRAASLTTPKDLEAVAVAATAGELEKNGQGA